MTDWRKLLDKLGDDRTIEIRRIDATTLEVRVSDVDPYGRRESAQVKHQAIEDAALDLMEYAIDNLITKLDNAERTPPETPDWRAWQSHLIVCADCTAGDECAEGQHILKGHHHDDAPWLQHLRVDRGGLSALSPDEEQHLRDSL